MKTNTKTENPDTIEIILARHQAEIDRFRADCKHEELSDWQFFAWAPGHFGPNMVKGCKRCGKIMEERLRTEAEDFQLYHPFKVVT